MIVGEYRDHAPRIPLTVSGTLGTVEVEFVLDTGFEGEVVLPVGIFRSVGGMRKGSQVRLLADGSSIECEVCYVFVEWDGKLRQAEALILEGNPLLGIELFENCHLDMETIEGGEVLIEPL